MNAHSPRRQPEVAGSIARALRQRGVKRVFAMPGSQAVHLLAALEAAGIEVIVPADETAAAFMANGEARVTGQPAVLVTINGPGFARAIPGLAEARLDSAGLLVLVASPPYGAEDAFQLQGVSTQLLASAVAKRFFRIGSTPAAPEVVVQALREAGEGEPGPVVVEWVHRAGLRHAAPADPLAPCPPPEHSGDGPLARPLDAPLLQEAVAAVAGSRQPVLLVGQGAAREADAIRRLAERWGAPVLTSCSGRGVIPEDHPLCMGFDAQRGNLPEANRLLADADLVLVLGFKLTRGGTAGLGLRWPATATSVRVDTGLPYAQSPLRCSHELAMPVAGFLAALPGLGPSAWDPARLASARAALRKVRGDPWEPRIGDEPAAVFFRRLREALPRRARLVTDSGMHQVMARRHHETYLPAGLLVPADFQSMGFGVPAAIGALLADPGTPVVALVGDGGLRMTASDIGTAAKLAVPLPIIVFVDGMLNQIRLGQLEETGIATGTQLPPVDVAALAAAHGAAHAVAGPATIGAALAAASMRRGPTLIQVEVADAPGTMGRAWLARLRRIGIVGGVFRRLRHMARESS